MQPNSCFKIRKSTYLVPGGEPNWKFLKIEAYKHGYKMKKSLSWKVVQNTAKWCSKLIATYRKQHGTDAMDKGYSTKY